ncbi:hypothetical protein P3T23_009628, partial [Paraburkholderia sp. GAS448]
MLRAMHGAWADKPVLTRHMVVVMPVGHLIMMHPVVTGIAMHALAF